jgi:zinc transport system substrate-binding protein
MSLVRRSLALVGALSASAVLAGCGQLGPDASGDGPRAVASFYPLAWVTEQVAGEDWTVQNLTQPGQEPHDLTLDVAQTAALESADLVVLEHGFQPAVDASADTADVPVLDATEVVDLRGADAHADDGHDHESGDLDPHFWLDPLLMADLGDATAERLAEVDPDAADTYRANAADLRTRLEELDAEYADGLASCERDTAVVSHEAFGYLERYGVHFEAIAGLSPDAEATAADLGRLQDLITTEGVTTVFSERLASPKMSQTLADDLGIDTAVLDPIEGLSDDTAGEDYLSLMRENLEALRLANGCA